MSKTYLTTETLAERIHYDPRTIRECLIDSVIHEGYGLSPRRRGFRAYPVVTDTHYR